MISVNTLLRESERVSNYINNGVRLAGAEDRAGVLSLFKNLHQLFPQWVISTCPMMHPDIQFMSKNAPHVFGYTVDELINNSPLEKYFAFIHDADQQDLYKCMGYTHDFLESIPPETHEQYRFGFHYRYRKANGQYIYLYDEKAAMTLKKGGILYYSLFRDLTDEKVFSGVRADLYKMGEAMEKISEFKPGLNNNSLSKREKELIILIRQGLSTKEMAWHLNISQHTVRNIKSRLFGKYQVSNSIELLNMAG